jgi:hypothetical protein
MVGRLARAQRRLNGLCFHCSLFDLCHFRVWVLMPVQVYYGGDFVPGRHERWTKEGRMEARRTHGAIVVLAVEEA